MVWGKTDRGETPTDRPCVDNDENDADDDNNNDGDENNDSDNHNEDDNDNVFVKPEVQGHMVKLTTFLLLIYIGYFLK